MTKRTSAKQTMTRLAVLLFSMAGAAGCEPFYDCGPTEDRPQVRCDVGGAARVTSSTFALSSTVEPVLGNGCLETDGRCSNRSSISYQSQKRPDGHYLSFGLQVAPTDGPGTYSMTGAAAVNVWGTISDETNVTGLNVTSGQLVITRNDESAFEATFKMELVGEDGVHHVSVTGGKVDVDDCEVVEVATCVDGGIGFGAIQ